MEPDWELEKAWRAFFCKCSLSLSVGRLPGFFKCIIHQYHFSPFFFFNRSNYPFVHSSTGKREEKPTKKQYLLKSNFLEVTFPAHHSQGFPEHCSPRHGLVDTHLIVKHLIKSHISSSPACRGWCLQAGWPSMAPQKGWCFCHATNVSCALARERSSFVRDLVPGWNYPSHQLQPIPFNPLQNRMTETKDGIWCLLEAEGICERFQFSSSIALSIGTEQKETALSRGPRVLILTAQWLLKGKKLKCPCSWFCQQGRLLQFNSKILHENIRLLIKLWLLSPFGANGNIKFNDSHRECSAPPPYGH